MALVKRTVRPEESTLVEVGPGLFEDDLRPNVGERADGEEQPRVDRESRVDEVAVEDDEEAEPEPDEDE